MILKQPVYYLFILFLISSCNTPALEKRDFTFLNDSLSIDEHLAKHNLAGFSLAVFEEYEIVYTNQWGVKSFNADEQIDINTSFSTASISKPVTALLCLILEEKGLINLDESIDKYLERWSLPRNQHNEDAKVTLKHFLNHTAGTSQHGFADFYEGDDIPTIKQSLMGEIPRYDKEIEFLFTPGESWQYSGGGYVIVQMALEDYLSTSIAELAQVHIFTPLGLNNTTMVQPNNEGFLTNVALVHDAEGKVISTGLPITPQIAPSGMWSTPADLAKLTLEIQNALRDKENTLISYDVAQEMTRVTALKNAVGGWSYGWQRSFGFDNYDWFSCNGSNTGVGGDIYATMSNGNGFVFLANGEKKNRFPVIDYARKRLLELLHWKKEISTTETQPVPEELITEITGTYDDFLYDQGFETKILQRDNKLFVESPFFEHFKGSKESEMVYLQNGSFKIMDYPNLIKFSTDSSKHVTLIRNGIEVAQPLIEK